MDRSTIKLEFLESLVTDEVIHDSAANNLTDSAPSCSGTNPEDATELIQEGSMNNHVNLGMNMEIQNEKMENGSIEPSLRMISNVVVIAPLEEGFEYDEQAQPEIQNFEEHIQLEEDINYPLVDNLNQTGRMEAQPVMENEMSEERPQEDTCTTLNICQRSDTEDKPYGCTICSKSFRTRQALQRHQRTHTEDKPYLCTVCDKNFKTRPNLKSHQRTHTGEKPHMCTICYERFTTRKGLQGHQRTHTLERPHLCTTCGQSYSTPQTLKDHHRKHTGEKPYACTTCDKRFTTRQHLTYHQKTHTGEKPYGCTTCDKSFITRQNLQRHQETHTGEEPKNTGEPHVIKTS